MSEALRGLFGGELSHRNNKQVSPVFCVALIITGMALPHTYADDGASVPRPVSLADARRLAFQRNWDLLAAKSDVDMATAQRLVSQEFPNPSGSFTSSQLGRHSGTDAGNDCWNRSYDTIAAVSQLFEIGGKRRARQESARAGLQSAGARLADARRLLDAGVCQGYVAALTAARRQEILAESAALLRKEAAIAEVRRGAGDLASMDKLQIEIASERLDLDEAAAKAAARNALIALEALLGEPNPQGRIIPADTLESLADLPCGATLATGRVSVRPDIAAAEAARAKAEADLRFQKAVRVPDPTLSVQYEHQPPDQPNTVGVGISLPLPLWNFNRGNIAAAKAAADQADIQLGRVRAQAVTETVSAQVSYAATLSRWHRYRDEVKPKSRDIRESVSFAYQKGGASLLDMLLAQRNDNDVRLETVQAAADAANAGALLRAALNESDASVSGKPE